MSTIEPKQLEPGWISRTQRAALRQLRAQPPHTIILGLCCPAASLLCENLLQVIGLSTLALILAYLFTAPAAPWRRHVPAICLVVAMSLFPAALVMNHNYSLSTPVDHLMRYGSFAMITMGFMPLLGVVVELLMLPLKIAGALPEGAAFTGTFGAFLHVETTLSWWASCGLGNRGTMLNIGPLGYFVLPFGIAATFPFLLPYMAAAWYAVFREIFYGPTPEPKKATVPMGRFAAAASATPRSPAFMVSPLLRR